MSPLKAAYGPMEEEGDLGLNYANDEGCFSTFGQRSLEFNLIN